MGKGKGPEVVKSGNWFTLQLQTSSMLRGKTDIERNALIAHFNSLKSKDQQDSMIRTSISKTGKL